MAEGRFVVLEGGEGAGKSTQAAMLSEWLESHGIPHVLAREPGGTPLGEAVRRLVLDRADFRVPPESELFLYLAARAVFVRDVVRPALEAGKTVIADRFSLSTLAYQAYGRGLDLDAVGRAVALATGGLEPDLYILLEVSVSEGAKRRTRAGREPDRIEREGERFLERVHEGYRALAASDPRVRTVRGTGTAEEVHRRVRELLATQLPETFGPSLV